MTDLWNTLLEEKIRGGYLDRIYAVFPTELGDAIDTRGWSAEEKVFCKINLLSIRGSAIATSPVSLDYTMRVSLDASPACQISDRRVAILDIPSHFATTSELIERYKEEVTGKAVQETYVASVEKFFNEMRDGLRRAIEETYRRI